MDWIKKIHKNNERRYKLIQLKHELNHLSKTFFEQSEGLKTKSDEFQSLFADFGANADFIISEIEQLETQQMLEKAEYWSIAIPQRPYGSSDGMDTHFWKKNYTHHTYYLTDEGKQIIRRQVFEEREMMTKPILSWAAIVIAIISLIVAVFKP